MMKLSLRAGIHRFPAGALCILGLLAGCSSPQGLQTPSAPTSAGLPATLPATAIPTAFSPTPTIPRATQAPTLASSLPTPTATQTPLPAADWVDVDWGALNALPPADYILYEGSNDLHALSQDGKVDRTIIHNRLAGRPAAPTALRYAADQPAGERITLTTLPEGPGSVVDLRRRGAAVLPAAHIDSKVFACSPDGRISPNERWAVFVCGPSAQPFLAVKDLDSGQVLTAPNTASEGRPEDYPSFSWSPDSRWIVYTRTTTRRFPKMQGTAELMLIDAGCLDRSFQTCPLQKSGPFALRDKMLSPAPLVTWSPDSQYFALTTWEGSFPILAFNVYARTFNSVEAVDGAHTASGIAWSVDRSWIAFSEGSQVKLIPMGGGRVTTLRGGQTGGEVRVVGWLSTFPRPVFQVGSILFITGAGHQLRLRETPGLQGTLVEVVSAGFSVRIVSGPVQADGYRWWKLKGDADTVSGWAIENSDWYAMKK